MTLQEMTAKYKGNEFKTEALKGPKPMISISLTFMRGKTKMKFVTVSSPDPEALDKVEAKIQAEINKKAPDPVTSMKELVKKAQGNNKKLK